MRVKPALKIRRNTDSDEMLAQLGESQTAPPPTNLIELSADRAIDDGASEPIPMDRYRIGAVIDVPLQDIDENTYGARVYYSSAEVEEMGISLKENGQEVAAVGYVEHGRVVLIDGQKRLRGARVGGLKSLRVEFKPKPSSHLGQYMESRRINIQRSQQTALDDATQWQKLLDQKAVSHSAELARQLEVSEAKISQTLALNRIPSRVRMAMIQRPTTSGLKIAYELSILFSKDGAEATPDLESLVLDLVDEIGEKELSVSQAKALIASRMSAPRTRSRAEAVPFHYGGVKGQLKTFPTSGKLELSIKGLAAEKLDALRKAIQGAIKG